jgi:hypothetical protein
MRDCEAKPSAAAGDDGTFTFKFAHNFVSICFPNPVSRARPFGMRRRQ